ncbi:MAG: flavodoxin family protein, partial [Prevotella sp.]
LIRRADSIVIGSPCYWGNMPGQLKILFDRMVYGLMGESRSGIPQPLHKGKKAVIVTVCNTIFPFNIIFNQSRGTAKALKEILKWSGFKVVASVGRGGMRKYPQLTSNDMRRCRNAMKRLLQPK